MPIEPQEIGRRLRTARERKGWTQLQFALEAHVSPSSVQRWERGVLPPIRELIRLADVLDIDAEQLVELAPTEDDQIVALREAQSKTDAKLERMAEMMQELLRRTGD